MHHPRELAIRALYHPKCTFPPQALSPTPRNLKRRPHYCVYCIISTAHCLCIILEHTLLLVRYLHTVEAFVSIFFCIQRMGLAVGAPGLEKRNEELESIPPAERAKPPTRRACPDGAAARAAAPVARGSTGVGRIGVGRVVAAAAVVAGEGEVAAGAIALPGGSDPNPRVMARTAREVRTRWRHSRLPPRRPAHLIQ